MKFRKKPVVIEATQWFCNGDHPRDGGFDPTRTNAVLPEGKIVRYYRTAALDGHNMCQHCGRFMHYHGWIYTLEGNNVVCPGDWIITGIKGEFYPCKSDIFEMTYESVEG